MHIALYCNESHNLSKPQPNTSAARFCQDKCTYNVHYYEYSSIYRSSLERRIIGQYDMGVKNIVLKGASGSREKREKNIEIIECFVQPSHTQKKYNDVSSVSQASHILIVSTTSIPPVMFSKSTMLEVHLPENNDYFYDSNIKRKPHTYQGVPFFGLPIYMPDDMAKYGSWLARTSLVFQEF